jgi:hypothetical protein
MSARPLNLLSLAFPLETPPPGGTLGPPGGDQKRESFAASGFRSAQRRRHLGRMTQNRPAAAGWFPMLATSCRQPVRVAR